MTEWLSDSPSMWAHVWSMDRSVRPWWEDIQRLSCYSKLTMTAVRHSAGRSNAGTLLDKTVSFRSDSGSADC